MRIRVSPIAPHQAILEILLGGENYGLGLRDAVFERTNGTLDLNCGTLYPALRALEREGLVASRTEPNRSKQGGRPRVYYVLTDEGRKVALDHRRRIATFYGFRSEVPDVTDVAPDVARDFLTD